MVPRGAILTSTKGHPNTQDAQSDDVNGKVDINDKV